MGFARKDVERTKMNAKKFVRYQEGAEKYSLGLIEDEFFGINFRLQIGRAHV